MFTDLFRSRAARPARTPVSPTVPPSAPDAAFAARPRLLALRDVLAAAARRPAPRRSRWKEPRVFFFDPARQAELAAARPPAPRPPPAKPAPHPTVELIAAELPALFASVEVRRVARAVPGLSAAAAELGRTVPAAKDLADLLAVPDDETVLVLYPAKRAGYRLHVRGVADVAQFHHLMLAAVTGDAADGLLPGPGVPARFLTAYGEVDPVVPAGVPMVAEARFHLFRPIAVRPDGTVPGGFDACAHWLWGKEPLAVVPRVNGERVVVLGDLAYQATWDVERRFPALAADARLLQVLSPFQVAERLGALAGRPVPVQAPVEREDVVLAAAA